MDNQVFNAIQNVVGHYLRDEEKNFFEHVNGNGDDPLHVYHSLNTLREWCRASNAGELEPEERPGTIVMHDMENNEVSMESHFGGCPECGKTDGYLNIGRAHVFICDEHKTQWWAGENLFSNWRSETEEDWNRNREKLKAYRTVKPIYPTDNSTQARQQRLIEVLIALCELDGIRRSSGPIASLVTKALSDDARDSDIEIAAHALGVVAKSRTLDSEIPF